jgi:hypothetical protein
MKILLLTLVTVVVFSCSKGPLYKVGSCFNSTGGLVVIEIKEVRDTSYMLTFHSIITTDLLMTFESVEDEFKRKGLTPQPCSDLLED